MLSAAAPVDVDDQDRQKRDNVPVPILSSEFETSEDGGYSFRYVSNIFNENLCRTQFLTPDAINFPCGSYETADGSYREEKATIINPGTENEMISVVGKYRYKNENGEVVEVSYTSDDHGFVPTGTIIHKEVMKNARIVSQQIDNEPEEDQVKYGGRKRN